MANRKLQAEIDRTLKKVQEGLAIFAETSDKAQSASSANQKEKYETDLKKEIKKLQRHRDVIKGWISSGEIKDKNSLLEARKAIESKMEIFKVFEKEAKTKAYSKEGLQQGTKADPIEIAKRETRNWVSTCLEKLDTQINIMEHELETFQTKKKGKKGSPEDIKFAQSETRIQKHKTHVKYLEKALRLMENDHIKPDQIGELKDSVEYYTDNNHDPDFVEDDDIYGFLGLDDMNEDELNAEDDDSDGDDDSDEDSDDSGAKPEPEQKPVPEVKKKEQSKPVTAPVAPTAAPAAATKATPSATSSPANPPANLSNVLTSPVKKATPPPTAATSQAQKGPTTKDATSVQGASPAQPAGSIKSPPTSQTPPLTAAKLTSPVEKSPQPTAATKSTPNATPNTTPSPMPSLSLSGAQPEKAAKPPIPVPVKAPEPRKAVAPSTTTAVNAPTNQTNPSLVAKNASPSIAATNPALNAPSPKPTPTPTQSNSSTPAPTTASLQSPAHTPGPQPSTGTASSSSPAAQGTTNANANTKAGSTANLSAKASPPSQPVSKPSSFASSPSASLSAGVEKVSAIGSPQNTAPDSWDDPQDDITFGAGSDDDEPGTLEKLSELTKGFMSMNLAPEEQRKDTTEEDVPSDTLSMLRTSMKFIPEGETENLNQYPSTPHPVFDDPAIYQKFDPDTLFFIFYYQHGTYQQYLAAKELKQQSWRFHKKYLTWFQRHEEPKSITEEYEQGTYVYFDYESGWCQRRKTEFTFEYRFLEDELIP